MLYPHDVRVILDDKFENGIRFEGDEGWVFCTRGEENVTASDPVAPPAAKRLGLCGPAIPRFFRRWAATPCAGCPAAPTTATGCESIAANRQPIAPIQQSARSLEACAAAWIGMKLKRKLEWDAARRGLSATTRRTPCAAARRASRSTILRLS